MVYLKTPEEIKKMREAGRILASVARQILEFSEAGVKLKYLNQVAGNLIRKAGAEPAFLNYRPHGAKKPYPCSICTSVNEIIVHGTPGEYKLKTGDILKLDFGVKYQNYIADAAWTKAIGNTSPEVQKLIETTRQALYKAIKVCRSENTTGDIGHAIQNYVESQGFKVVRELTGHGIGKELHEDPNIFNEGERGRGLKLESGLVIAIEPMVSAGSEKIIQLKDDSYATADGSLSAHFEHTVAITNGAPEILTLE